MFGHSTHSPSRAVRENRYIRSLISRGNENSRLFATLSGSSLMSSSLRPWCFVWWEREKRYRVANEGGKMSDRTIQEHQLG
jgi:hypothetical protein